MRGASFYRYEMAGLTQPEDWETWARNVLGEAGTERQWAEYEDRKARKYRAGLFLDGVLDSCLFIGPTPDLPDRAWLAGLFSAPTLTTGDRLSLLAGKPAGASLNCGKTICACFGVGENTIRTAIREKHLDSVEAIGQHLRAGTNCGSCIPELHKILDSVD